MVLDLALLAPVLGVLPTNALQAMSATTCRSLWHRASFDCGARGNEQRLRSDAAS